MHHHHLLPLLLFLRGCNGQIPPRKGWKRSPPASAKMGRDGQVQSRKVFPGPPKWGHWVRHTQERGLRKGRCPPWMPVAQGLTSAAAKSRTRSKREKKVWLHWKGVWRPLGPARKTLPNSEPRRPGQAFEASVCSPAVISHLPGALPVEDLAKEKSRQPGHPAENVELDVKRSDPGRPWPPTTGDCSLERGVAARQPGVHSRQDSRFLDGGDGPSPNTARPEGGCLIIRRHYQCLLPSWLKPLLGGESDWLTSLRSRCCTNKTKRVIINNVILIANRKMQALALSL